MGALAAFGLAGPLPTQIILFALLSIVLLVFFRSRLLRPVQLDPQRPAVDTLVGEVGTADDDLAPGAVGRIELRGTAWSARNLATEIVLKGARCRVVGVDGLTVQVEPERSH